jgi:hypothetical protein|tara:strand:+ start:2378 stop:2695 length:318 start_codon:yes stop_codon:yes gene_type:complete
MKALKLFLILCLAFFTVSPIFASAYIYTQGDLNPYYQRPYNYYNSYQGNRHYGNYFGGYSGYGYRSNFYTSGYNDYSRTYGFYTGGDPYFKYTVLDSFLRSSPRR